MNEWIERYTGRDWAVLPLHGIADGRCTCGKADCKSPGKHPCTRNGVKNASADPRLAAFSFRHAPPYPNVNIGIAFGAASKMIGVDIDGEEGERTLAAVMNGAKMPQTYECRSGRDGGGRHLYFKLPPGVMVPNHKDGGLEIKSNGAYLVAPPSMHHTGRRYEVVSDTGAAPLPDALAHFAINKIQLNGNVAAPAKHGKRLRAAEPLPDFGTPSAGIFELAAMVDAKDMLDNATYDSGKLPVWLRDEFTENKFRSALAAIPVEARDDREVWLKTGMALHSLNWPESRDWWDEWSRASAKFDPEDQDRTWASFKRGGGVTANAIFDMAMKYGSKPPEPPPEPKKKERGGELTKGNMKDWRDFALTCSINGGSLNRLGFVLSSLPWDINGVDYALPIWIEAYKASPVTTKTRNQSGGKNGRS